MLTSGDLRHLRGQPPVATRMRSAETAGADHNGVGIKAGWPDRAPMHLRQQPFVDAVQPQDFLARLAFSVCQSNRVSPTVQPKPRASAKDSLKCAAWL